MTNAYGEIVTVGHTFVSGQGENVYLMKTDADGNMIFQTNWNSSGAYNDYGTNLYEVPGGDIYVCGTTDNGGMTDFDVVVLRFNSSGVLQSSNIINGSSGKNDIATALVLHPTTNNLLISAGSENSATGYDYLVLEVNSTSLSQINSNTYDYAGLTDVPLGIDIDTSTGDILLVGGSQSSIVKCAYALVVFNGSTLVFNSDTRTDLVGSPNDQPTAFIKDGNSNVYITGKTLNGTQYDLKTVKINSNFSIAWTATLDVMGNDDGGTTISLDPVTGDVIVGGYTFNSTNKSDILLVRYSNTTGTTVFTPFIQPSENNSGDAAIKKISTNTKGDVYFIAKEKGNSGYNQAVVGKLNKSGIGGWQRKIVNPSSDILPSDIEVAADGIYAISILDSAMDKYITTGYTELSLDTTRHFIGSEASYMEHELLIDFHPNSINKSAIDNQVGTRIAEFGNLSDFLTTAANNAVNAAFEGICRECQFKAALMPALR